MNISEFEENVLEIEEVHIRIRASVNTEVRDYAYQRRAANNMSVTEWLNGRIFPCLGNLEVAIIDGHYQHPHGNTTMDTLRQSYQR